jgi:hypothetical protein
MASLQQVFNRVLLGETVVISHFDKAEYDSFVVSIRRKLRLLEKTLDEIGGESPYADKYIRCSLDKTQVTGTYQLLPKTDRHTARKEYVALL